MISTLDLSKIIYKSKKEHFIRFRKKQFFQKLFPYNPDKTKNKIGSFVTLIGTGPQPFQKVEVSLSKHKISFPEPPNTFWWHGASRDKNCYLLSNQKVKILILL